jgi:hypothetical protein
MKLSQFYAKSTEMGNSMVRSIKAKDADPKIKTRGAIHSFKLSLKYRISSATAMIGVQALRASGLFGGYWKHWRGDLFDYAEERGIHVLPVHYYTPIPTKQDRARPRRKSSLNGLVLDVQAGADRANSMVEKYIDEIALLLRGSGQYDPTNAGFHPLDAALLYASVREARPRRIIEIGAGMSSFVIADALRGAGLTNANFTCIEPFLPDYLSPSLPGISEIIERPLQDVDLERFKQLECNDILFIDSTHVVRYGSDVVYEILEILPILRPGVIVHVHDIFFPDDYPQRWLNRDRFFWNEQYMLQAFLCMNPHFQIDIPAHAIRLKLSSVLKSLIYETNSEVEPASLWMRRV